MCSWLSLCAISRGVLLATYSRNPPYDLCFLFGNRPSSGIARDSAVPVCQPTRRQTLGDAPGLASTNLVRIVLTVELSDQSAQSDEDRVRHPFMNRANFDAEKRQPLVDARQVLHVTGQPIQSLHD